MVEKITYSDFMALCKRNGINVIKITRDYIHLDSDASMEPKLKLVQNMCTIGNLGDIDINLEWTDGYWNDTLADAIKYRKKILAIKIIRANTHCGLKDSKDLYESNESKWREIVGCND